MPHMLLQEVMRAARLEGNDDQNIVIDLCAGFRSLENICAAEGLHYVPVDIKYKMAPMV